MVGTFTRLLLLKFPWGSQIYFVKIRNILIFYYLSINLIFNLMSNFKSVLKVAGLVLSFLALLGIWIFTGCVITWMILTAKYYILSFLFVLLMWWFLRSTGKLLKVISDKIQIKYE